MAHNNEVVVTDDLDVLLAVLPDRIRAALQLRDVTSLLEMILDLGRLPEARYPDIAVDLEADIVSAEDLAYVVERIGAFGDDNRAGIERTLHRISAIRNRRGEVVGLTCRVGRAVRGTVALIRDVVEQGKTILILGRPGVGKTTLLREAARVLADELGKRVVIVDTSNEIAGDGDVPHPGIGRARRMQVARPAEQHAGHDRGGGEPHARGDRHRRDRHRAGGAGGAHHRRARRAAGGHGAWPDAGQPAGESRRSPIWSAASRR